MILSRNLIDPGFALIVELAIKQSAAVFLCKKIIRYEVFQAIAVGIDRQAVAGQFFGNKRLYVLIYARYGDTPEGLIGKCRIQIDAQCFLLHVGAYAVHTELLQFDFRILVGRQIVLYAPFQHGGGILCCRRQRHRKKIYSNKVYV